MYNLKIKNRDDQILTVEQGLAIIKILTGARGSISLVIGGENIGYFPVSEIRIEKITRSHNGFSKYEDDESFVEKSEKKKEWTENEFKKLDSEQKTLLLNLTFYMYPFLKLGDHNKFGVRQLGGMLLRHIRGCPFDVNKRKLLFKPLSGYSHVECIQRFGSDLSRMDFLLNGYMEEMDISILRA